MLRFKRAVGAALCFVLLVTVGAEPFAAQGIASQDPSPAKRPADSADQKTKKDKKDKQSRQAAKSTNPNGSSGGGGSDSATDDELVSVTADRQSKEGELSIYEGYVNATQGDYRLQADRVSLNTATGDMVAEGNVIFDQGPDQRVTSRRAELNWQSHLGTFWDTTGFTNRTQTGEYLFYTASRIVKTGEDTYEMYDAVVTACEDVIPKWTFRASRAELKMGDRLILHGAVFRIKTLPAFVLPYAWIPATRNERKSGFLLPNTGSSNQKGRTFKTAYYQTLGDSADITFRGDIYTERGIGLGAEFRAQTDEKSYLRLGVFTVKDRLFGEPGEDEGGTAIVGEGVQYLPHGWLAVGNMSLVTSLRFRQVFSDDISQVIDPRRESQFYANNNTGGFSLNILAANETTTLFSPSTPTDPETEFDVKVRQAPEIGLNIYPRRIHPKLPIYFSIDSSLGALKRQENVDETTVMVTPSAVQRFDIQPKLTVPLATVAGFAVTPSIAFRETFYTSSVDPDEPFFDPNLFSLTPADPRLDPLRPEFDPRIRLYDRALFEPIVQDSIARSYTELAVDVRPPSLEKTYLASDGTARFKHLIESYVTYRRIDGIGEDFERIIRFDERDAVANTNEFEYAFVNRFFVNRSSSDPLPERRRRTRQGRTVETRPVTPGTREKKQSDARPDAAQPPVDPNQPTTSEQEKKQKLEQGEKAELTGRTDAQRRDTDQRDQPEDDPSMASNVDEPEQPHELLSIKIAQKYFFDRDFGGALVEGRRNQFYPINTLTGFTFGGVEREFSPVNLSVRYRPLASVFADLRMDIGASGEGVRSLTVSGGFRTDRATVTTSYYLSRRIELEPNRFEPGTFPGNQIVTTLQLGDDLKGMYGGTRIGYDFTDRFVEGLGISDGRLRNSRSYLGYAWDCCGIQFNYATFKAGLRNESAFSFSFTLAGLGSFGSDQFAQLGGGRGGRGRGRRRANRDDDLP
jgi:LPS-assembly protein